MKVILSPQAEKQLKKLPKIDQIAIVKKIRAIKDTTAVSQEEKLRDFRNIFRVRVGDYRIVYRKTHQEIYVARLTILFSPLCIDNSNTFIIIYSMKLKIEFSEAKNLILKATRGVCFEDVIKAVERGNIIDDLEHRKKNRYPYQRILVIKIKKYIYAVPYVINKERGVIFLKTVYPSRVLTKKYLKSEAK